MDRTSGTGGSVALGDDRNGAAFWGRVARGAPDACWPWTGATDPKLGYGSLRFGGRNEKAHRVAFSLAFGYWPNVCRHSCDNPPCCNPAHLFDGTQKDNIQDAKRKGRLRGGSSHPGEHNGAAILTKEDVLLIYEARKRGATITELGTCFGVSKANIWLIVSGKNWPHLFAESGLSKA
jgi:HNH endonuclease